MNSENPQASHKPVLLQEVVRLLNPAAGKTYLDLTAGGGGHATVIAAAIGERNLTLVDADPYAAAALGHKFPKATIYNSSFADQLTRLKEQGQLFDMILADLGLSSLQLDASSRGFSFLRDGPLDMRFNPSSGLPLRERLEHISTVELEKILRDYGQEKAARAISRRIKSTHPQTTLELAQLVAETKAGKIYKKRLHPATQTFMALRIWMNDEIEQLTALLQVAPSLLRPAGRLAVISFHSLEDRLVKHAFKDLAEGTYSAEYLLKTSKPAVPSIHSLASHPQARSAKLRVLERF